MEINPRYTAVQPLFMVPFSTDVISCLWAKFYNLTTAAGNKEQLTKWVQWKSTCVSHWRTKFVNLVKLCCRFRGVMQISGILYWRQESTTNNISTGNEWASIYFFCNSEQPLCTTLFKKNRKKEYSERNLGYTMCQLLYWATCMCSFI